MTKGLRLNRLYALAIVAAATPLALGATKPSQSIIDVTAVDFQFGLRPSTAKAGLIQFNLRNKGSAPHDFVIDGKGRTPVLAHGQAGTVRIRLAPGIYTYLCSVPGHADAGMRGRLTVTAQ